MTATSPTRIPKTPGTEVAIVTRLGNAMTYTRQADESFLLRAYGRTFPRQTVADVFDACRRSVIVMIDEPEQLMEPCS